MPSDANPAAALRAAMRDLLSMFTETLGDEAGAAALKTAVERALSEVTGAASKRTGPPPKFSPKPVAKPAARKSAPAPQGRKKKAKPGPPSPGRLRQIAAMKEYWRKQKAGSEAKKEPSGSTTA